MVATAKPVATEASSVATKKAPTQMKNISEKSLNLTSGVLKPGATCAVNMAEYQVLSQFLELV
jgi:hypothetical protein